MDGALADLAASEDHREAVASFLEKRAAVFKRREFGPPGVIVGPEADSD